MVWLIKKDESPFVDAQGKEAVNFQISILIYLLVSFLLVFAIIGVILMPAVALFALICTIIGAVQAGKGLPYRYPLSLRFIR